MIELTRNQTMPTNLYQIKLSPYAKTFYLEWLLERTNGRYNITIDQKLFGSLDIERLSKALGRYVEGHVLLNSHIQVISGEPYWVRNEHISTLEYIDGPCTHDDLRNFVCTGFDLESGALYKFRLIRTSEQEFRFIVVFHHIIIDGSSGNKGLFENLSNFYNIGDYSPIYSIEQQINMLENFTSTIDAELVKNEGALKNFWQEQLSNSEGVDLTFLKSDFAIKDSRAFHYEPQIGEIRFDFDSSELSKVSQLKRKYRITPYIYGQCIFAMLIHKHTNQSVFSISYPVAIKSGVDFIYGAQVNTNFATYKFDQIKTVQELFDQCRMFFRSLKQDNVNFDYYPVVNILQNKQEGGKRLLDVSFVQTNFKDKTYQFDGIQKVEVLDEFNIDLISPLLFTDFASHLFFEQELRNQQINYRVRYNKELIDEKLLNNFVENYKRLFLNVLDDLMNGDMPRQLSKYETLSEGQYDQLINKWNQTTRDFPQDKTIHQLFEEQTAKTPDSVAVIFDDNEYTYLEINQQANQLAHYLQKNWSVQPDDFIGVMTDRGQHMLIAILAVLKAGAAYVPLDINYPESRIAYILGDTKAKLVITEKLHQSQLKKIISQSPTTSVELIVPDEKPFPQQIAQQEKINPSGHVCSDNLAYVIYTSGSTGRPKGVMIEHKGIVNRISWMNRICPLTELDRIIQKTPYVFDVSVWELFWANWYGACIVFAKPDGHKDPRYLCKLIQKYKITVTHFIPCMLHVFQDALENYNETISLPSLRYLFCSGEVLDVGVVKKISKLLPDVDIYNLYGPTEASIDVLYFRCTQRSNVNAVYIGKPIDNTTAYILDSNLAPLPVGAVGELCIGGVGLARGYLNLPELTAEKFVSNPFQHSANDKIPPSTRLYRTGDHARWLTDGNIEYIGRSDQQVKINGYRIELGEIEATLNDFPQISQSIVVAKELRDSQKESGSHKYLIGYVVLTPSRGQQDTTEYVSTWQALYQEIYKDLSLIKTSNDFTGWNDSITGAPIVNEQMEEWLSNGIEKITSLNPKNILEIGSGSGLILFNMIDKCQRYYATDFSAAAMNYLHKRIDTNGFNRKTALFNCKADEIPFNEMRGPIDTVIINSVIQYFPNAEYLERVISNLIANLGELATIYLGDIRNYQLLEIFYYSILKGKNESVSKADIDSHKVRDKELLLSPQYFINMANAIPEISYIEVLAKDCNFSNELSKFRYDLVLHIERASPLNENIKHEIVRYSEFRMENDIVRHLNNLHSSNFILLKYPNKNLYADCLSYRNVVNQFDMTYLDFDDGQLMGITAIKKLASDHDFNVSFYLDVYNGEFLNIIFSKKQLGARRFKIVYDALERRRRYFNHPDESTKMMRTEMSDEIKQYLHQKLPSYMVPEVLIFLNNFPLTINGKLDQDALPEPYVDIDKDYVAPRNKAEKKVCDVFSDILALPKDKVGINHDFFKLGGNSVLAIRLATALQRNFKLDVSDVFKLKTPEKIAQSSQFTEENLRHKLDQIKLMYTNPIQPSTADEIEMKRKYQHYLKGVKKFKFQKQTREIQNVMLTGGTGHLGCNVLFHLIFETEYQIYLPVRASSDRTAFERLRKKFAHYFELDLDMYKNRIIVFSANLEYPTLNTHPARYQELISNVDSIIHSAALVKHYGNSEEFHKSNVQATINLLELSKVMRGKDFHYMSTAGVLLNGQIKNRTQYIFDENDDANNLTDRNNTYIESKHNAEQIVRQYRQRGINCNIYRLGNLSMHSTNFRVQENIEENAFFTCIRTIFALGFIAKEIAQVEISPVDQSALAIVKIFQQVNLSNLTFHLFNPNFFDLFNFFESNKALNIESVCIDRFIDLIAENLNTKTDNRFIELFMLHQSWLHERDNRSFVDIKVVTDKTISILNELNFQWPTITDEIFDKAIVQLIRDPLFNTDQPENSHK